MNWEKLCSNAENTIANLLKAGDKTDFFWGGGGGAVVRRNAIRTVMKRSCALVI